MLINYLFMLYLSIHLTISTVSANQTSISSSNNSETHILQNNASANVSAPLAIIQSKDDQQKIKINKKGERVLNRGIAPTNLNSIANNSSNVSKIITKLNETQAITIVTEGSGVSKINLKNDTLAIAVAGQKVNNLTKIPAAMTTTTTKAPLPIVLNATEVKLHETKASGIVTTTIKPTLVVAQNKTSILVKSPTTTTTTSTTTTTTSTTTSTTTPKPKKPKVTYSIDDMPDLAKVIPSSSSNNKFPSETKSSAPKLSVEEPEIPHVQPSQEFDGGLYRNHRDYIIPIVSIIFAVPILMGMVIVAYRRFRDFWSTRHYRRMDFLVDGMYND
ncbi:uncharacterized protein LOC129911157 [Episyrphus balteatus]|uniref:uncharacterized protein LOC129911157 n=1 Tax=Episyrphus balteatus TaxID=286459 RepID=UPI002484E37A|nr:uncharacterized protein LOC129911157 [Episyrphus balteatus]